MTVYGTVLLTERLFDLFSSGQETQVDERGDANTGNSRPSELSDELERKEKEVDPDGATRRDTSVHDWEECRMTYCRI